MVNPQGCLNRMLNLVSLDQESGYYSSVSRKGGDSVLGKSMISSETRMVLLTRVDICYNACERLSFNVVGDSPPHHQEMSFWTESHFPCVSDIVCVIRKRSTCSATHHERLKILCKDFPNSHRNVKKACIHSLFI